MTESDPVRVLVVDDQQLVREGIAALLDIQPGVTVVGTAPDGKAAVNAAIELQPHVVLMDLRMPEMDGVEATAILHRRAPQIRVVMLTTFDDEEYVVRALHAGAAGYLLKDLPAADLAQAVRLANAGVAQLDCSITDRLAAALASDRARFVAPPPAPRPDQVLTAREIDILGLIATGSTNREIASRLFLSEGTVKNHISRILGRLRLRDRTQAALYARDHGLLPDR
ncbi:response regulator transcription factor [Micromonospora sp. KC207]|uniref:response regulator n=1 Tax=Micromonospora sp. KC207 TaxID=2530377 RepID=UPI00104FD2BE|nr:response regulator transcription factor [Micromonospora sp. KC207]TDC44972.1 response regulator transcription factor [Micromonospora sp. KC207]